MTLPGSFGHVEVSCRLARSLREHNYMPSTDYRLAGRKAEYLNLPPFPRHSCQRTKRDDERGQDAGCIPRPRSIVWVWHSIGFGCQGSTVIWTGRLSQLYAWPGQFQLVYTALVAILTSSYTVVHAQKEVCSGPHSKTPPDIAESWHHRRLRSMTIFGRSSEIPLYDKVSPCSGRADRRYFDLNRRCFGYPVEREHAIDFIVYFGFPIEDAPRSP